jgi:hypothetical protein
LSKIPAVSQGVLLSQAEIFSISLKTQPKTQNLCILPKTNPSSIDWPQPSGTVGLLCEMDHGVCPTARYSRSPLLGTFERT